MFNKLSLNKVGLSEIVGYVLMILLSVTIAGLIYGAFITFVPRDDGPTCPDGVSLVIQDLECDHTEVEIDFLNKGTFTIIGFQGRATTSDERFPSWSDKVMKYESLSNPPCFSGDDSDGNVIFCSDSSNQNPLIPGENSFDGSNDNTKKFKVDGLGGDIEQVRITPIVQVEDRFDEWGGDKIVFCWDKTIVVKCP